MFSIKYFKGIREAQKSQRPLSALPPFDLGRLKSKGFASRITGYLFDDPRWALALLRRFWPNLAISNFLLVTRADDVRDILERGDDFETPYGPEMAEMARGSDFILGMQDGADYRQLKSSVLSAFPPAEIEAVVRPIAAFHSKDIMTRASPGFDAIGGLMKVVPVRICRDYIGIEVDDEAEFADWTVALSALFFSDPTASTVIRELAVVAADRLIRVIDRSIEAIRCEEVQRDVPLARLVAMLDQGRLSLADVHSVMLGMIVGFVPTNLLAGGNCLEVIFSRYAARQAVDEALADSDTDKLDKAIREAMRFKPIWVGPWRYTARDTIIAKGTRRERKVKEGTVVMPATLSAMFDPAAVQNPNDFDMSRPDHDYLVFGHGIHQCIGAEIARVQIAESMRALFEKKGMRRMAGKAGRMKRVGTYPENLKVDFERQELCKTVAHSMVTVVCPIKNTTSLDELRTRIATLGNPATEDICAALNDTGIIHFTSIAVVETEKPDDGSAQATGVLVLEVSGDGSIDDVIDAVAVGIGSHIRPIFEEDCGLPAKGELRDYLRKHNVEISASFGSNAGLVFSGTPGHSVERIQAEAELAETVRSIVEKPRPENGGAAKVLAEVRQAIKSDERFKWAFEPAESLLEKPKGSLWKATKATLLNPIVLTIVTAFILVCWRVTYVLVFSNPTGFVPGTILIAGTALLLTVLGLLSLAGLILGLYFLALRRLEKRDLPNDTAVDLDRLDKILAREDRWGQNHLTAVSTMKAGTLRKLALRLAFYLISISAQKVFKPGILGTLDTIHFARWVAVPGSNRLMFLSNYGGSWESYLEDFIAKASLGLNGVWSNTEGYPRTRWLFLDGACDSDRFKRWARRQQIPTLFWYSAYPHLNTIRIRINSKIRRGIASASEYEARDWLSLFGSLPRPQVETSVNGSTSAPVASVVEQLETGEIQSIFFSPFGSLEAAQMLAIHVPEDLTRTQRKTWLEYICKKTSFGDGMWPERAMVVAFGPEGLRRLGLDGGVDANPLDSFPVAFRHGMGNPERSRILDDVVESSPEKWQWGSLQKPVDVMVVCFAKDIDTLKDEVAAVEARTADAGMIVRAQLPLAIRRQGRRAVEHFGFVDGVSQPIVRGTAKANAGVAPMHLVAPGEFLFGYRDEHGFYPASPNVEATHDRDGILPLVPGNAQSDKQRQPAHDFGRNGSFLVVRQFEQHVDAFHDYCKAAAKQVANETDNSQVNERWIAAKMLGRWPDGSSLVRNPDGRPKRGADNDYSFGVEDPQGHKCPLGAHVRRSNPRDSLGEDRDMQIRITKRHRIIRVGRTYEKPKDAGDKAEQGLLFMCLNADIERQYEFIQQTWISSTTFQGLIAEKDPTIGSRSGEGRFTIPSWEGATVLTGIPQFVTTRGGGYFFMPSRSALRYLISRL